MTMDDADVAFKIWWKNIAALKGKTIRKTPYPTVMDIMQIPKAICELHRNVTLSIDIFFVNQIPFLLTLSRNIWFTTVTHLADRRLSTIYKELRGIVLYYYNHGFQVTVIPADESLHH